MADISAYGRAGLLEAYLEVGLSNCGLSLYWHPFFFLSKLIWSPEVFFQILENSGLWWLSAICHFPSSDRCILNWSLSSDFTFCKRLTYTEKLARTENKTANVFSDKSFFKSGNLGWAKNEILTGKWFQSCHSLPFPFSSFSFFVVVIVLDWDSYYLLNPGILRLKREIWDHVFFQRKAHLRRPTVHKLT